MAKSFRSITSKLVWAFGLSFALVFFAVFTESFRLSEHMLENRARENAENLAMGTINGIEKALSATAQVPLGLARVLEQAPFTPETLERWLEVLVRENPEIYGSTTAFEPFLYDRARRFYAPYYYREKGEIRRIELGGKDYNYHLMDWYQLPRELGRAIWSEPYFDEGGGGIIMSTYSVPFYELQGKERHIQGVVTADISLSWLQEVLSKLRVQRTGYAFLVSRNGTFITHPRAELVMNDTVFDLAELQGDQDIRRMGRSMLRGESGYVHLKANALTGKESFLVYRPVPSAGWSLGMVYPRGEIFADVDRLRGLAIFLGALGLLVMLLVVVLVARSITRSLRALSTSAAVIASGDLEAPLPVVRANDEVGDLARAFGHMRDSLQQHIKNLVEATAAKHRVESELSLAFGIQMDILPHVFPPFPDRHEFSLFATMKPARVVGGDLYDFLLLDDRRLFFVVGDVSDKGMPAALFMSMTVTLLRTLATTLPEPADILARVNRELCRGNSSCMFVTVFVGILDLATGRIRYADAGHNPPILLPAGGGQARTLTVLPRKGIALGIDPEASFSSAELLLAPGDALLLYTDGITESFDGAGEMFGDARLVQTACTQGQLAVEALVQAVLSDVERFVNGAPQSDDMTLLALGYRGPASGQGGPSTPSKEILIQNDLQEVLRAQTSLTSFLEEHGCSAEVDNAANLSLEEVLVNIITHGFEDEARHQIRVGFGIAAEGGRRLLRIEIEDDAAPFDPLQSAAPDLDAPLAERKIGGLGIHLVRHLMDEVRYERRDGRNRLTLEKKL